MDNVTDYEKRNLLHKMLEFQKIGLVSYGKYLNAQLELASKSTMSDAYKKYVEDQLQLNNQKINELDQKLD